MLALRFLQALPYRCCRRQYIFLNNRGPITWQAKNQSVVALFTLEAEYIACSDRTGEAIWLRCLLADIKKIGDSSKVSNSLNSPTPIWFENQGALRLIKNGVVKAKAKHIDVRYHHSHDEQKRGTVEFAYITSKKNVADLFYQISSSSNAPELIQMLGMIPENWPLYSCWTNYWYLCLSSKIEMSFMFYAYSTIVRICKYAIFWLGWILERGGCVVWHKTYSYVITPLLLSNYLTTYILLTFIHLSIRHDMQPGSPLEKQIKCLKGERTNNPEVVPYSPHEQVQNAKIECGTAIPKVKKQLPPPRWPSPVLSPPPRPRGGEGSFVIRANRHGCAKFLLAKLGIREVVQRALSWMPTRRIGWTFEGSTSYRYPGGDTVWSDASSRCLRSLSDSGYTCKPGPASGHTHYHIVAIFEAKESGGAPGVLAQSLGVVETIFPTDGIRQWS